MKTLLPETPDRRWSREDLHTKWPTSAVYWLRASDGTLIYVGKSRRLLERLRVHKRRSWWPAVALIEFEVFRHENAALAAEVEAIHTEAPMFNVRSAVA